MGENVFVNNFFSIGLHDFFAQSKENIFERHIIECLCEIYGTDEIKRAYDIGDESGFTSLMYKYGLTKSAYDNLLRDTIKYEQFKKENKEDPSRKSDIACNIEVTIISMYLYKCLISEPTMEQVSHFENILLNNFDIIKLHFNTSINPTRTRDIWNKKKKVLMNTVELIEVKPSYLDDETYVRFGTNLKDVKQMDYRMVEELNKYITSKLDVVEIEQPSRKQQTSIVGLLKNTALSSGNGAVDALMIAAVAVTEISLGLIYLFLHW